MPVVMQPPKYAQRRWHVLLVLGWCLQISVSNLISLQTSTQALTIRSNKSTIHLAQTLTAILQSLSNIMRPGQLGALVEQDINLDPNAIAGVIGSDALEAIDDGAEPVAQVQQLLLEVRVGGLAGQTGDVFEAGPGPVVDDEEGEEAGADGVEPPGAGLCADEGEEEGEGVEVDVGFAVCVGEEEEWSAGGY